MKTETLRNLLVAGALVAGGMMVGAITTSNVAQGEVRDTPQPPSFQTGGQMSVPILKEIAATLHTIDARLAKLEIVAQKMQSQRSGAKAGN